MAEPSQTIRLRDGRTLGWIVYGDPAGQPVLAFHGAPACRLLFAPADAAAARLGLRLVAPDRPGYGLSDAAPGRILNDWITDTSQLMDRLAIARAPIIAISGGGPYAVAVAAGLGARITGLALVSPLGEVANRQARARMTRLQRAFYRKLARHPLLLRRSLSMARAAYLAGPEASYATLRTMVSEADRRVLSDPNVRTLIMDVTREALRTGIEGSMSDMMIFCRPWGIDISTVECPSVLWQGNADHIVPAGVAFMLGASLPGCSVRRLDGQGHFWVLKHVREVLETVAAFPS
jgi:pimeloyl-ACP methyl ester carboxylesterase